MFHSTNVRKIAKYCRRTISTSRKCDKTPTRDDKGASLSDAQIEKKFLRNIGIIAHINAGKTTTTERILYHAGSTQTVGDVDKGNTITDYLIQERDRGITITSAAVTYKWKKHMINLIDTPGHVDFTIEVERSLSVLDGAVTLLDASAGIEAQTVTVWNQAARYNLANIIFLNKMDKPQADHMMCLKDLKVNLGIKVGLIQLPVKSANNRIDTVIDVINRRALSWPEPERDNGSSYLNQSLDEFQATTKKPDKKLLDEVERVRECLVNDLADSDEKLASHVIECDRIGQVSDEEIREALRRCVIKTEYCPVLLGSSFKYVGVQQLMDAINNYLPTPVEREEQILQRFGLNKKAITSSQQPCAFIFKIMHDKRLGALNYLRIFGGKINRMQSLKNLQTNKVEQIKRIFRPFADELTEIEKPVFKDDIVIVTGLSDSRTGDILVEQGFSKAEENSVESSRGEMELQAGEQPSPSGQVSMEEEAYEPSKAIAAARNRQPFLLLNNELLVPNIPRMEPVYFCTIESPSTSKQMKLEEALACLSREDPSFTYEVDTLGVGTIRGMGKLHLEIMRDRIMSEYGVDSILGPMQISYRETISGCAVEELKVNRLINGVRNRLSLKLYVRSLANSGAWNQKRLRLDCGPESTLSTMRADHRRAVETGVSRAMMHGPLLGYPMVDCDVLLLEFQANYRCGLALISSAASQCLMQAFSRCSPFLMEPIMLLEVVAPKAHNSTIVGDLSSTRRGVVISTQARSATDSIVVRAHVPLATLADYSEHLRILTSGRASFSMELHNYAAVSESERSNIVRI